MDPIDTPSGPDPIDFTWESDRGAEAGRARGPQQRPPALEIQREEGPGGGFNGSPARAQAAAATRAGLEAEGCSWVVGWCQTHTAPSGLRVALFVTGAHRHTHPTLLSRSTSAHRTESSTRAYHRPSPPKLPHASYVYLNVYPSPLRTLVKDIRCDLWMGGGGVDAMCG